MSEATAVREVLVLDLVREMGKCKTDPKIFFSRDNGTALTNRLSAWVAGKGEEFKSQVLSMIMYNSKSYTDGYVFELPDYLKAKKQLGIEAFSWLVNNVDIFEGLNASIVQDTVHPEVYYITIPEETNADGLKF